SRRRSRHSGGVARQHSGCARFRGVRTQAAHRLAEPAPRCPPRAPRPRKNHAAARESGSCLRPCLPSTVAPGGSFRSLKIARIDYHGKGYLGDLLAGFKVPEDVVSSTSKANIMGIETFLTRQLGLAFPIIQAPLAGGGDTPELVAAVSNAGAIGFIGAAYLNPEQLAGASASVRAITSRPYGVNLFAPLPPAEAQKRPEPMLARLAPYFAELGLPARSAPKSIRYFFEDQLAAALESGASCFSFTFGMISRSAVQAIKARGLFLIGTATTVEEAIALEKSGVDAIVSQGSEAGGHRGTFAGDFSSGMVGSMALVPQVVDAVR